MPGSDECGAEHRPYSPGTDDADVLPVHLMDPVLDSGVPVDQKYAPQRAKQTDVVGLSTARFKRFTRRVARS
ncbi:hypothetical protein GCM10010199_60480 [Dactylosporangium roseum]